MIAKGVTCVLLLVVGQMWGTKMRMEQLGRPLTLASQLLGRHQTTLLARPRLGRQIGWT
jgi:hypothetical protein